MSLFLLIEETSILNNKRMLGREEKHICSCETHD